MNYLLFYQRPPFPLRALVLNPGGTSKLLNYAASLCYAGRSEEAIQLFQKAIRLNLFNPAGLY
jgi:hypothetical protein